MQKCEVFRTGNLFSPNSIFPICLHLAICSYVAGGFASLQCILKIKKLKIEKNKKNKITWQEDLPACNGFYPPQLRLLMYVIGGREVGQVFKGSLI